MKETRFVYRHKETNKWLVINVISPDWMAGHVYGYALVDDLPTDNLYKARNIIEEDFEGCFKNDIEYSHDHYELVEIEVEYKDLSKRIPLNSLTLPTDSAKMSQVRI